ncbi:hypothetical protein ZWY2020_007641 [Hordeum vulgare]|nr:hypothetical protein ZWY2020_007641 [Hordeum vulgare]
MDKAEVENLDGSRPMTPCGAALVHHRMKSGFPQMPLQDSMKKWQRGFFYVKNASPNRDAINMPPFAIEPPTTKKNWQANRPPTLLHHLFEKLQGFTTPTPDVETSDPSEIEDEGMIELRDAVSEEALESKAPSHLVST